MKRYYFILEDERHNDLGAAIPDGSNKQSAINRAKKWMHENGVSFAILSVNSMITDNLLDAIDIDLKEDNSMETNFAIYKQQDWFWRKYDGRKKEFKSISRNDFKAAKERHISRMSNSYVRNEYKSRRECLAYFAGIPYEYQGDGMDDYNRYQRPASNGVGYVAICPGERANNYYVDDPILVAYLTKKYNKHNGK